MDLDLMKYAQLQKLAKKYSIKANQKAAVLRSELHKVLNQEEARSSESPKQDKLDEADFSQTEEGSAHESLTHEKNEVPNKHDTPTISAAVTVNTANGSSPVLDNNQSAEPTDNTDLSQQLNSDNQTYNDNLPTSDEQGSTNTEITLSCTQIQNQAADQSYQDNSIKITNDEVNISENKEPDLPNIGAETSEESPRSNSDGNRQKRRATYELESPSDTHGKSPGPQAKKLRRSSFSELPVVEKSPVVVDDRGRRSSTYELESPSASPSNSLSTANRRSKVRLSDIHDLPVVGTESPAPAKRNSRNSLKQVTPSAVDVIPSADTGDRRSSLRRRSGRLSGVGQQEATTPTCDTKMVTELEKGTPKLNMKSPVPNINAQSVDVQSASGVDSESSAIEVTTTTNPVTQSACFLQPITDDAMDVTGSTEVDSQSAAVDFASLSKRRSEEGSGLDWMEQLMSKINKAADEKESEIEDKVDKKMASLDPTASAHKQNSKTPNFKKLHDKNFSRMTDITAVHARRMKHISSNNTHNSNKKTTPSTVRSLIGTNSVSKRTGIPSPVSKAVASQKPRTPASQSRLLQKPRTPLSASRVRTEVRKATPGVTTVKPSGTPTQPERTGPRIIKPIRGGGGGVGTSATKPAADKTRTQPKSATRPLSAAPVLSKTPKSNVRASLYSPTVSSLKKTVSQTRGSPSTASPKLCRTGAQTTKPAFTIGSPPTKPTGAAAVTKRQPLKSTNRKTFDIRESLKNKPTWKSHKGPLGQTNTTSGTRRLTTLNENLQKRKQLTMANRRLKDSSI